MKKPAYLAGFFCFRFFGATFGLAFGFASFRSASSNRCSDSSQPSSRAAFTNLSCWPTDDFGMARKYLFADEAGDFNFARGTNISKYFIVCTVTAGQCDVAHDLLELRRKLVWEKKPVREYFHASVDAQIVRDSVFEAIATHKFGVQATIMEKSKAQSHIRSTKHRFYQYGWLYHFRHAINPHVTHGDELFVTAASVGTKKGQAIFTNAVNDVIQQHLPRTKWATSFWPSATDPCLQVADYCAWAIQRKWERNDVKSYDVIKHRISHEYDLWGHGSTHYY